MSIPIPESKKDYAITKFRFEIDQAFNALGIFLQGFIKDSQQGKQIIESCRQRIHNALKEATSEPDPDRPCCMCGRGSSASPHA